MKKNFRLPAAFLLCCGLLVLNGCVSSQSRCLAKAEEGDAEAQGALGSMYLTGNGMLIDYDKAYHWLRLGAANGDSIAAYYLGVMSQYGMGKVTPDRARAERHYKSVYKNIHDNARKGKLECINILGEMYYYGRGLEQNKADALKMFRYCAKRRWQPAIENLGVIFYGDRELRDYNKARTFLIEAAAHDYPRAQFFLSQYYFNRNNREEAMRLLKAAEAGGFPPAKYKLAQEYMKAGIPGADRLFKAAAEDGYAPAMLVVAAGIPHVDQKIVWIKRAAEHSSVPAMLEYAKLIRDRVTPDYAKEMVLYLLALKIKKDSPEINELILELDNKTGLFFPVKYTWEKIQGGENILLANSEIERILNGFKVGIVEASRKLYEERLAYNPLPFFMNNDWYLIYENSLPMMWAAQLFRAVEKYEGDNPGLWIAYGISAALAGQGTAQAFAAFKLNELIKSRDKMPGNDSLKNIAILMKANALILLDRDKEAYAALFNNGRLIREDLPFLVNFINHWCRPLLKDKRKFSIATGIDIKKLGKFCLPQKQEFLNLEYGRAIPVSPQIKEPQIDLSGFRKK
ncbi:MAG: tetratricopeptide repeat protein [Victivallaceae bacterium]|nr:tetratricopeptide repeat protein [Victivallaceae bacterium]